MKLKLYRKIPVDIADIVEFERVTIADIVEIECVTFAYTAETNTLTAFLIIDRQPVTEIYENIFGLSPVVDVEEYENIFSLSPIVDFED